MNKKLAVSTVVSVIFFTGCATPHVVQSTKPGDSILTCSQLDSEFEDIERFKADAQKEKGATGTNVAAAIFFWPGMLATYSNANDAIAATDARRTHLSKIYEKKKCAEKAQVEESVKGGSESESEKKLMHLKSMLDKGLITKEEHDVKRKKIISDL